MKLQKENQSVVKRGRPGRVWMTEEDATLRASYLQQSNEELALQFGTSAFAVQKRLHELKLLRPAGRPKKNLVKPGGHQPHLSRTGISIGQSNEAGCRLVKIDGGTTIIVMPGQDPQEQADLYRFRQNQKEFTGKIQKQCSRPMRISSPMK